MKGIHSSALHVIIAGIAHLIQPGYGGGKDSRSCASIVNYDLDADVLVCNIVHKHSQHNKSIVCSSVQDYGLTYINIVECTLTSLPVCQATSINCDFFYDSFIVVCNSVHEPTHQDGSVVCTNAYSKHSRVNNVQCTHIPGVLSQSGRNTCEAVKKVDIEADFVVCTSLFHDTLKKEKELCIRIFDQVSQTSSNFCNQVNHPLHEAIKLDCTAFRGQPKTRASLMCSTVLVDNFRSTSCAVFYDGRHQSGTLDCTKHDEALARTFLPDCTTTSNMLLCVDVFEKVQTVGSIACFSAFINAPKNHVTFCEDLGDHDYVEPSDTLYCSDDQRQLKETGSVPCIDVFSFTSRDGQILCDVLVGRTIDTTSIVCITITYEEDSEDEEQGDFHERTTTIVCSTMKCNEVSEDEDDYYQQTAHIGEIESYIPPKYAVQKGFFGWLKETIYAVYDFFVGTWSSFLEIVKKYFKITTQVSRCARSVWNTAWRKDVDSLMNAVSDCSRAALG